MRLTHLLHAVSVLGVVAIVGTVTGTTTASWTDTATLNAGQVRSGFLSLAATAADTALTVGAKNSAMTLITLDRNGAGANLRAVTSLTRVDTDGLHVEVRTKQPDDCPTGNSNGHFTTWDDAPIQVPGASPAEVNVPLTVCVRLTLPERQEETVVPVNLTFVTHQVRDGQPSGWTAEATARIAVHAPAGNGKRLAASDQTVNSSGPVAGPPAGKTPTPSPKPSAAAAAAQAPSELRGDASLATPATETPHEPPTPAAAQQQPPSPPEEALPPATSDDDPSTTEETHTR
jgi:predicted ribosomally synthesized peptide with SipW-like signal peptide